jgi:hypothetical protein
MQMELRVNSSPQSRPESVHAAGEVIESGQLWRHTNQKRPLVDVCSAPRKVTCSAFRRCGASCLHYGETTARPLRILAALLPRTYVDFL